jgi:Na+/melibiose symporter-like transporter
VRAGLKLSKGLHHMQHAKYKIIGITISIICIALMSIIIYDCKERVKKEKQIRKKLGVFVDIILDILDWYQLVIVIIVGLIIGGDSNYIFINSK